MLCVSSILKAFVFHSGKEYHISEPTEHVNTVLCTEYCENRVNFVRQTTNITENSVKLHGCG